MGDGLGLVVNRGTSHCVANACPCWVAGIEAGPMAKVGKAKDLLVAGVFFGLDLGGAFVTTFDEAERLWRGWLF